MALSRMRKRSLSKGFNFRVLQPPTKNAKLKPPRNFLYPYGIQECCAKVPYLSRKRSIAKRLCISTRVLINAQFWVPFHLAMELKQICRLRYNCFCMLIVNKFSIFDAKSSGDI